MRYRALPSRGVLMRRLARGFATSTGIIALSLGLGILGYHRFGGLPWLDALLNAAMILAGEGPVDPMRTAAAKAFATLYALFSGVVFISVASILIAPAAHYLLHRFHLEAQEGPEHLERR